MKFLVPVARQSLEDGQRMAAIFAQHHCDTRAAGQLYAAWRQGSPAIRKRLLAEPELFFKSQRQEVKSSTTPAAEVLRDPEMVVAIVNRAHRRLAGAASGELDFQQREAARQQIARIEKQLARIDEKLLPEKGPPVEPGATHHDSGTERAASEQTRDRAVLGISRVAVRKILRSNSSTVPELQRAEKAEPWSRTRARGKPNTSA